MGPYEHPDFLDLDNPYAPPQSAFAAAPAPFVPLQAGMPFSAIDVLNRSWEIFKEKMGICLAIYWGVYGLNLAIYFCMILLLVALFAAARDAALFLPVGRFFTNVAYWVVSLWLAIGQGRAFLKIVRDQPVMFGEVFLGGRYLLTVIGATIGLIVALIMPFVLCGLILGVGFALLGNESMGGILFLTVGMGMVAVLGLYIVARLSMYFYLIIDRDAGVIDSLLQSWQLTTNRAGTIILVFLTTFAICVAGFLALCVGAIFAIPLCTVMFVVTYLSLVGTGSPPPEKAGLIWEDGP